MPCNLSEARRDALLWPIWRKACTLSAADLRDAHDGGLFSGADLGESHRCYDRYTRSRQRASTYLVGGGAHAKYRNGKIIGKGSFRVWVSDPESISLCIGQVLLAGLLPCMYVLPEAPSAHRYHCPHQGVREGGGQQFVFRRIVTPFLCHMGYSGISQAFLSSRPIE